MTICGGLQRWSSKLAGCGMLAQRSIGGSEKKMSCAVASIAWPRWTKMLSGSKERGSNQHQVGISSCKSRRRDLCSPSSPAASQVSSMRWLLSVDFSVVSFIFNFVKMAISLCRISFRLA